MQTLTGAAAASSLQLRFDRGTIIVDGAAADPGLPLVVWDERTQVWRAPAHAYREVVLELRRRGAVYTDAVRRYEAIGLSLVQPIVPRQHQAEALKAWVGGGRRGVVQLPTGAGKTFLAVLAIVQTGRPTLVVVPTIDLLHQWQTVLAAHLGVPVGALGGGSRDLQPVTVSTYDSAVLHIEAIGNRFGLLIVDECHHLPAPQYQAVAFGSIAAFRLGLSATVARADGKEADIYRLVGPLVYDARIDQMVTTVLAPYEVVSMEVPMTADEEQQYVAARAVYTSFLKRYGINFSQGRGWSDFIMKAARLPGGREAMQGYRAQKRLAQASSAKLEELWRIFGRHRDDRIIVFTEDNAMAYRIGCTFVLPVLTHQTKLAERKRMLAAFRSGELQTLVTSKVLNEGVDVPEARIGVVVSGSGGVREHVQRLGRLLRHRPGKEALLYELVSKGTSEIYVNQRRKQHHAYQGASEI